LKCEEKFFEIVWDILRNIYMKNHEFRSPWRL
jgi:hypothetical protein